MTDQNGQEGWGDKLAEAYHRMLERVRSSLTDAEGGLGHALDHAKQAASDLGELSREEAERVGEYLRRDVEHAAGFLNRSGREFGDWLRFDMELLEQGIADMFLKAVDQSRVELGALEERAEILSEWHTGEVSGLGTLKCNECGELLHFNRPGRIPPCPRCRNTTFHRLSEEEEKGSE